MRSRRPSQQTLSVLSALAGDPAAWRHGYELCQTLELKAGTVYPILIRLAERGLVETRWEEEAPSGRPPRHLYRLSSQGVEFVEEVRQRDGGVVHTVFTAPDAVLGGSPE